MSHDIIMTNLTVDVSGAYTSMYKKSVEENVKCKVYTVFIRGVLFFFFFTLLLKNSLFLSCNSHLCRAGQMQDIA